MKFDLHVHTRLSYDSHLETSALCDAAIKAGLSGVAVADHNAFRPHSPRNGIYFIPACEFSTDVGHLLVYFLKEHINESLSRDESGRFFWRDVCQFAHNQGAVVFLAHPFSPSMPHTDALWEELDGIEVYNARVSHSRIKGANERALELCKSLKKPFSAGSDAHSEAEVGVTYWECDLPESAMNEPDFEDRLRAELLSGKGRVFAGDASPFVVLKCKRRTYRELGLYSKLFKNELFRIYTAASCIFGHKKHEDGYLDMKG